MSVAARFDRISDIAIELPSNARMQRNAADENELAAEPLAFLPSSSKHLCGRLVNGEPE
jgi:hypothetical protein